MRQGLAAMFLLAFLLCQFPPHASAGVRTSATPHPAFQPLDPAAGRATGLLHSWWSDNLGAAGSVSLVGAWHLAVATYDGHGRRLYLDGVPLAADAPASQPVVALANLALGQTNGTERLMGSLADVAIYLYALSPAQVGRRHALGEHPPLRRRPRACCSTATTARGG